jgi:5-methylcytosine-specific restriction endonuclease McrA
VTEANSSQTKYCRPCAATVRSERIKAFNKGHPERHRIYNQRSQHRNLEKYRVYNNNRYARKKGNGGKLPTDVEKILFELQEGRCYLCGELLYARFNDPVNIEHKIPIVRGGPNIITNVGLSHASCNNRKYNKTVEEFLK